MAEPGRLYGIETWNVTTRYWKVINHLKGKVKENKHRLLYRVRRMDTDRPHYEILKYRLNDK